MWDLRRIVIGVDLQPEGGLGAGARLALARGRFLADAFSAHVTLVHSARAEESWDPAREAFLPAHERPPATDRSALAGALEELRAGGIDADAVVSEETAWLALVHQVLRAGADLAIVGKRAGPRHDARPVGSVAHKLLRKCPCAVWVVKPGSAPLPRCVLAATDRSAVGGRVVELAAGLARCFGASLHVVHALALPLSVQLEGEEATRAFLEAARAEAESEIDAQVRAAAGSAAAGIHVGLTSPSRAVLEGATRLDADLVVMGTVSRGGVAGLLVGNTAERLLGRLGCSILAVKPDDFVCPVAPAVAATGC